MTFLYPLYLLGIALTAIPIVIHLWFRKRLKRVPFSTLQFLKRTEAKRFGWLRLREILTLVLRCLIILFLFLSLSRPRLTSVLLGAGRSASVVLMLDNSYSMGYGNNFARAQETAHTIIARYSPKSEFFVAPLCNLDQRDSLVPRAGVSKTSAHKLIEDITLSHHTGTIRDALSGLDFSEHRYPLEYIYIGDGQEHNFMEFPAELGGARFNWLEVPLGSNVVITHVSLKDPIAVPLDQYTLLVEVTNHSPRTWRGTTALEADDYRREKECIIESDGTVRVEFLIPTTLRHGTVTVYDDSLTIDNTYYFSKSPAKQLSILIVGDDDFLRSALSTSQHARAPFRVESVEDLGTADLRNYDVIVLNGIREISESARIKLDNFRTQTEKAVIIFLGESVGNVLQSFVAPCCTVDTLLLPRGYVTLDWIDYSDPTFEVFVGTTTLLNARFYRVQKVTPRSKVIARVTGNHPFIIKHDNLVVITAPVTPDATDLIYTAAFVPMLYRLTTSSIGVSYDKELLLGETVTGAQTTRAPTGALVPDSSVLQTPGFYSVDGHIVGVNVVPEEGRVKKLGTESATALAISKISIERDAAGSDLSTILLYCALGAFVLELLLLAL
ncbi:hypothetical protein AMJ87_06505 [candidate division WOR_3 bacterium SM23_60]|uniref:Aerotolerance regulator N-terminal domain-containing protein n=1 Tax=candidate division WOR_3 bacterium SM23_60 TaxID=1703780 RepID=A0A0S8GGG0_UNCW3|nr:MAG: hypothetical protein AMJ87_06505 [candidate division WOR_3 bacterium SM23_60]